MGAVVIYRLYDAVLRSDVALNDYLPNDAQPAAFFFALTTPQPQTADADWFHEWTIPRPDGVERQWLRLGRQGDSLLMRFPGLADFHVEESSRVECRPAAEIPLSTISHLFLDQVMPLLLAQTGRRIVHASCVLHHGAAIAFAAPSGFGKSTLAAALSRAGCNLLTDDGLLLREGPNGLECLAGYPGLRLWQDSTQHFYGHEAEMADFAHYTSKKRILLGGASSETAPQFHPLRRIYFLGPPGASDIAIEPLSPREAFIELVRYSYQLDPRDQSRLMAGFQEITRLAGQDVFYRLNYPRQWEVLPDVVAAVLAHR